MSSSRITALLLVPFDAALPTDDPDEEEEHEDTSTDHSWCHVAQGKEQRLWCGYEDGSILPAWCSTHAQGRVLYTAASRLEPQHGTARGPVSFGIYPKSYGSPPHLVPPHTTTDCDHEPWPRGAVTALLQTPHPLNKASQGDDGDDNEAEQHAGRGGLLLGAMYGTLWSGHEDGTLVCWNITPISLPKSVHGDDDDQRSEAEGEPDEVDTAVTRALRAQATQRKKRAAQEALDTMIPYHERRVCCIPPFAHSRRDRGGTSPARCLHFWTGVLQSGSDRVGSFEAMYLFCGGGSDGTVHVIRLTPDNRGKTCATEPREDQSLRDEEEEPDSDKRARNDDVAVQQHQPETPKTRTSSFDFIRRNVFCSPNEGGESNVAVTCLATTTQILVTGYENGRIVAWRMKLQSVTSEHATPRSPTSQSSDAQMHCVGEALFSLRNEHMSPIRGLCVLDAATATSQLRLPRSELLATLVRGLYRSTMQESGDSRGEEDEANEADASVAEVEAEDGAEEDSSPEEHGAVSKVQGKEVHVVPEDVERGMWGLSVDLDGRLLLWTPPIEESLASRARRREKAQRQLERRMREKQREDANTKGEEQEQEQEQEMEQESIPEEHAEDTRDHHQDSSTIANDARAPTEAPSDEIPLTSFPRCAHVECEVRILGDAPTEGIVSFSSSFPLSVDTHEDSTGARPLALLHFGCTDGTLRVIDTPSWIDDYRFHYDQRVSRVQRRLSEITAARERLSRQIKHRQTRMRKAIRKQCAQERQRKKEEERQRRKEEEQQRRREEKSHDDDLEGSQQESEEHIPSNTSQADEDEVEQEQEQEQENEIELPPDATVERVLKDFSTYEEEQRIALERLVRTRQIVTVSMRTSATRSDSLEQTTHANRSVGAHRPRPTHSCPHAPHVSYFGPFNSSVRHVQPLSGANNPNGSCKVVISQWDQACVICTNPRQRNFS